MSGVFCHYPPQDQSPEEIKKYKSYLTRVSKWASYDQQNKECLIKDSTLRSFLASRGEMVPYMDPSWSKRVFGDKDAFTDMGDGFWKLTQVRPEDEPAEPAKWIGPRPGEDLLGTSLKVAYENIIKCRTELNLQSRHLDHSTWDPIHRSMVDVLERTKKKGIERPLNDLQERAFIEALVDDDKSVQIVTLWLTNTRMLVDVMARLLSATKGQVDIYPGELDFYASATVPVTIRDGTMDATRPEPTYDTCLKNVRKLLLRRGVLSNNSKR